MANSAAYMEGRQKYKRPQALLFSDNPGTLVAAPTLADPSRMVYIPTGTEYGTDPEFADTESLDQFLILSDDNRSDLGFNINRIEKRERMINGRMRSYHIADKLNLSLSWTNLPSRSFALYPNFGSDGKPGELITDKVTNTSMPTQYTTDGGAGGVDLLDWYENHTGSFWLFLAYDKYTIFEGDDNKYAHLPQYNQVMEVFFSNFDYSVVKRGNLMDLWNVNITLEEA